MRHALCRRVTTSLLSFHHSTDAKSAPQTQHQLACLCCSPCTKHHLDFVFCEFSQQATIQKGKEACCFNQTRQNKLHLSPSIDSYLCQQISTEFHDLRTHETCEGHSSRLAGMVSCANDDDGDEQERPLLSLRFLLPRYCTTSCAMLTLSHSLRVLLLTGPWIISLSCLCSSS